MRKFLVVSCLLLVVSCSAWALVDLGEVGVGARVLGMGKASVSGMDDASSIFTNPAAVTLNPNLNIISMSGSILTDVGYLTVGAVDNSPWGRIGIGYVNASVGGIPITTITGTGSTAAVSWEGNTDYSSSIIYFTYGTNLSRFLWGNFDAISFGASLKYFLQGFSGGGTSMQEAVGNGLDADVGFVWDVKPWARLGATFNNCLPFQYGGKFTWQKNSEEESIPMATRLGGSFKIFGESALFAKKDQALDLNLEYENGRGANRPVVWHTGLEFWPIEMVALRLGIDQKATATTTGVGVDNNLTAGVGLVYLGFTFDYAYHQLGDVAENTTHFFSLGYRGPEEKIKEAIKDKFVIKESVVPLAEVAPKPMLKTFSDVAAGYWASKPIEYLATLGIMGGYPDKTFRPQRALTRGELATLLVKAKGFNVQGESKNVFRDVSSKSWVAPYVKVAVDRGYVKGYPNGTFQPNRKITRAEAATVFAKFAGLYVKPKIQSNVFSDVKKGHWAAPAIAAGKNIGLYEYLAGKGFGPNEYLTRAEAAEILSKTPFIKEDIKKLISGERS
ncbi:MAG: S-layer homology domain-containing protein [Candidatus Margulisiibacteriota bacterium]